MPLPGDFNVANALAAIAGCGRGRLRRRRVVPPASPPAPACPGRLERVDAGQDFVVVVDYAHKPDAVEAALRTLRPLTGGRLIVVHRRRRRPRPGQAADDGRDRRPAGRRAGRHRRQPPHRGPGRDPRRDARRRPRRRRAEVLEVGDRRAAIREAIGRARPGDVVLVAGKGHETGQEIAGVVHPFDDRDGRPRGAAAGCGRPPMIPMTLAEIAAVVGGSARRRRPGDGGRPARRTSTPASAVPGGLFVAVAGERVDGHDFAAARRGAVAVLGSRRRPACRRVVVDDPVRGARAAGPARGRPGCRDRRVVGADRFAGQDRHQGLPGAACSPTSRPDGRDRAATTTTSSASRSPCCGPTRRPGYLVVEMGARGIGHIAYLCEIAPPRIAAVLNVGTRPHRRVRRPRAIALAKGEIVEALPADGMAVLNADDPLVARDGVADPAPGR